MNYTQDALASGRKFRTRNLMDGYTREAVAIETDTSLPGARVVRVLGGQNERVRSQLPTLLLVAVVHEMLRLDGRD